MIEHRARLVTPLDEYLDQHGAPARYGLRVIELGEEGGTLVAAGHHPDRRTLAAFAHYARTVWGEPLDGLYGPKAPTADEVQRVRGILVHSCERGWAAEDPIAGDRIETVTPENPCPDCAREGAVWALLSRADVQDHPDSFPITVWEYDS